MSVSSLSPQNCYLRHREFYQALSSNPERLQPPLGGCRQPITVVSAMPEGHLGLPNLA
ncbi:MAG: hypothetical protein QNJ46_06670 [Leptolyngbyaceae cyanobacterium MO_188.B28]|nr:hypothetical protein [Leptolyngbyaceae cyanobacterium MO_188.B28]